MAKKFLGGCFAQTLTSLSQNSYWRNPFSDQLNISYRRFLIDKTITDMDHSTVSENVIDSFVHTQLGALVETKQSIKAANQERAQALKDTRVIESKSRRVVHFMFKPCGTNKISPFARKLKLMAEGELEEFEREERERVETYLDKLVEEQLEDHERFPTTFIDNPYFDLELNSINHISFAVADNPFYKTQVDKYYPEALVLSDSGEIIAHLGGGKPNSQIVDYPSLRYRQNFRDDKMRVNDDRKIEAKLSEFTQPGTQIIFMIRTNDLRQERNIPENTYDSAWFRLQNEQTS